MFYDMLLLKILNVSERTGMSVVPRGSDVFTEQKLVVQKGTRMYTSEQAIRREIKATSLNLVLTNTRVRARWLFADYIRSDWVPTDTFLLPF